MLVRCSFKSISILVIQVEETFNETKTNLNGLSWEMRQLRILQAIVRCFAVMALCGGGMGWVGLVGCWGGRCKSPAPKMSWVRRELYVWSRRRKGVWSVARVTGLMRAIAINVDKVLIR